MSHLRTYQRVFLATSLALLVALTSMATAMGQVRAAAVGEMVLCTGHGPRLVLIDADGNPTQPRTTCPDCLLATADLPTAAPTAPHVLALALAAATSVVIVSDLGFASDAAHQPRAPPAA